MRQGKLFLDIRLSLFGLVNQGLMFLIDVAKKHAQPMSCSAGGITLLTQRQSRGTFDQFIRGCSEAARKKGKETFTLDIAVTGTFCDILVLSISLYRLSIEVSK